MVLASSVNIMGIVADRYNQAVSGGMMHPFPDRFQRKKRFRRRIVERNPGSVGMFHSPFNRHNIRQLSKLRMLPETARLGVSKTRNILATPGASIKANKNLNSWIGFSKV